MKLIALVMLMLSASAQAALFADPKIAGAKLCTQHFPQAERLHGIPGNLLAAISNTESGRWNDQLGMVLPWPWTINAEGKGYYFNSKAEAIRKVRALQATGMKSIDIGCMQVNLKHHPTAFANLDQAFEPRSNIAYAAKYLRSHYDDMGNWQKAIGAYHSKTPKYGNKYRARVNKSWSAITGKVNIAREALDRAPRRASQLSYRVINVEGAEAQSSVKTIRPEPARQPAKRFSLAMRDAPAEGAVGIALRPQDRITSVPNVSVPKPASSYKRISLGGEKPRSSTTIIRPSTASTGATGGSSNSGAFVSQHGDSAPVSSRGAPKAKFIFVE